MRKLPQIYYFMIWMGVGIIGATITSNRLFASGLVNYQMLYQNLQQGWQNSMDKRGWTMIQTGLIRVFETAVIGFVCERAATRRRKTGVYLLICYIGVVTGVSMVLLTWCRGIAGLFCCFALSLPHDLFYLSAWGLMILHVESGSLMRNRRFLAVVFLLILVGIISEIWLNPYLLRFV